MELETCKFLKIIHVSKRYWNKRTHRTSSPLLSSLSFSIHISSRNSNLLNLPCNNFFFSFFFFFFLNKFPSTNRSQAIWWPNAHPSHVFSFPQSISKSLYEFHTMEGLYIADILSFMGGYRGVPLVDLHNSGRYRSMRLSRTRITKTATHHDLCMDTCMVFRNHHHIFFFLLPSFPFSTTNIFSRSRNASSSVNESRLKSMVNNKLMVCKWCLKGWREWFIRVEQM